MTKSQLRLLEAIGAEPLSTKLQLAMALGRSVGALHRALLTLRDQGFVDVTADWGYFLTPRGKDTVRLAKEGCLRLDRRSDNMNPSPVT